jgi:uncharacterized protein
VRNAIFAALVVLLPALGLTADTPAGARPNNVVYFELQADDFARARRFYQDVFDWQFYSMGTDYYFIRTGNSQKPGIGGGLVRRAQAQSGKGIYGFVCTIAVASVDAVAAAIEKQGGRVLEPPHQVPGVGRLLYFADTEGNRVGAMQYDIQVD